MENLNAPLPDPGVEEVLDEIVDLEEYARLGKKPPLSRGYRIKVNGEPFVIHEPQPTGRDILTLAGLLPAVNLPPQWNRREGHPLYLGSEAMAPTFTHGVEFHVVNWKPTGTRRVYR